MNVKPLREGIGSYALCAPRLCGGQPGGTESVVPNEANLPGAGRPREIRSTKPEIRNKLEKQMIQTDQSAPNEPNFRRFWPENEGRRENEANPCGREAGHWGFRIADCGFGAVEAWNAETWNVKRTQLGGANGRWARPALRDGRRNAGRSGRPPVAGSRGPGMSNEPNLQRFWPENEGRCENEANFRPGAASDRHQCYSHRQAGACRRHVSRGRIVRNKANLKTEPGQWPEPCVRARLRLR